MLSEVCTDCRTYTLRRTRECFDACTNCGLVVNDCRIEEGPEHRNYDDGLDKSHYGVPCVMDEMRKKPRLTTTTCVKGNAGGPNLVRPLETGSPDPDSALRRNLLELNEHMNRMDVLPVKRKLAEAAYTKNWHNRGSNMRKDKIMAACVYHATRDMQATNIEFNTPVRVIKSGLDELIQNGAIPRPHEALNDRPQTANPYVSRIQDLRPGLDCPTKMKVGTECLRINELAIQACEKRSKRPDIFDTAVTLVALKRVMGEDVSGDVLSAYAGACNMAVSTINKHRNDMDRCLQDDEKRMAQPRPSIDDPPSA